MNEMPPSTPDPFHPAPACGPLRPLDLDQAIESLLPAIRRPLAGRLDVVWRPSNASLSVMLSEAHLNIILRALADKALRCAGTEHGGRMLIAVSALDDPATEGFSRRDMPSEGPCVLLDVGDSGATAPDSSASEIATAEVVATRCRGRLFRVDHGAKGSLCRILFPRVVPKGVASPNPAPTPRNATILLVDDQPEMAALKTGLEKEGYRVWLATCGEDALRTAEAMDPPPDLLVTDVIMPDINGLQLYQRLRETRPRLKVLYMSGYSADALAESGHGPRPIPFIAKPFSREELCAAVDAVVCEGTV